MTISVNALWKSVKAGGLIGSYGVAATSTRLLVYSGAMPATSAWNTPFDLATYAPQLLASWNNFTMQRATGTNALTFATAMSASNALATGTATWCVLLHGPTSDTVGTATDFIIGDADLINTNALLQLSTVSLVTGSPVTPLNFYLTF